jgi:PAS domain S-box-containing protein
MHLANLSPSNKERYIWRILLVDDDEDDYVLIRQMIAEARERKFVLEWASTFKAGKELLEVDRSFDAVIVDYDLRSDTGIELIRAAVAQQYPAPFLLLTGHGTYELDVQAMEAGAADYLSKGEINAVFLERAIRYTIEQKRHETILHENEAELRKNSEALRESEERFRALFNNRHSVMLLIDPKTALIVDANPAACSFYGWSREEMIGMKITEINTLPVELTRQKMSQAQTAATSVLFEFQHRLASSELRHVTVHSGPIHINGKEYLFSIIHDITDQKKLQQALHEGEARYRTFFDNLHEIVVLYEAIRDEQGQVIDWTFIDINTSGTQYLGLDRSQVVGKRASAVYAPAAMANFQQHLQVLTTGEPSTHEVSINGKIFLRTVFRMDQNTVAITGIDITERKHIEEALRQEHDRAVWLARLPEENSSPVARATADGRILYHNPAAANLPGWKYKLNELIGEPLLAMVHQAMQQKQEVQQDVQLDDRFYSISVMPFPEENYVNLYGRDITERRRLQLESIEHHTEMEVQRRLSEYRERERQEIARDLHDGPVQDLSGLIFGIQFTKEAIQDPTIRLELEQIRSSLKETVQDLRGMINELRPPSLIRFGVIKAIQFHAEDFREKHPELEIDLDLTPLAGETRLPDQVNLSLFRIYQEGMNNIARHSQATKVWIKIGLVGDHILLELRDNGRGFSLAEGLIDHTLNNHFGLAGMKERAVAIGGEIQVSSAPGQGTTIRVTVKIYNIDE